MVNVDIIHSHLPLPLRTEIGYLYVVGFRRCELKYTRNDEYCTLSVDDEIRKHDKRIISCRFVDDQFVFVRKRGDRNHPNSLKTIKGNIIIFKLKMKCNKFRNRQLFSKTEYGGKSCVQGAPLILS